MTLLGELAKVIARAVADGDLDLAIRLAEAAKQPGPPAGVVRLADARVKRGGA